MAAWAPMHYHRRVPPVWSTGNEGEIGAKDTHRGGRVRGAVDGFGGGWGFSPGFVERLVELYSRSTADTAESSVSGRYVWPESGWYVGGAAEGAVTEESPSERDVQSSAYRIVGGRYLGDTTTLDVTLGTSRERQDPDEVVCEAFARRCFGLGGSDTDTEEAAVSVRHVGKLWSTTYSVRAGVRSSRSDYRLIRPRLLDPQGRAITGFPSTGREFAVEDGELLYSDETRVYLLSAAWYPRPALGVQLSYLAVKQDEFGDADGVGLSVGWFFRRNVSAKVSFTRTRLDAAFEPEFRNSDTASLRLLGRF